MWFIYMAGNTGAGESQPRSDLFHPNRICLHFTPACKPMNLPEGKYVHNL
jgi:hypothetical protein